MCSYQVVEFRRGAGCVPLDPCSSPLWRWLFHLRVQCEALVCLGAHQEFEQSTQVPTPVIPFTSVSMQLGGEKFDAQI